MYRKREVIKIQLHLNTEKEEIDYDSLYINYVDGIVFYKNEVMSLDVFKEKYMEDKDNETESTPTTI